jgi:hypothetical protein
MDWKICSAGPEQNSRQRGWAACGDLQIEILTVWRLASPCISVSIARPLHVLRSGYTA